MFAVTNTVVRLVTVVVLTKFGIGRILKELDTPAESMEEEVEFHP